MKDTKQKLIIIFISCVINTNSLQFAIFIECNRRDYKVQVVRCFHLYKIFIKKKKTKPRYKPPNKTFFFFLISAKLLKNHVL